MLTKAVRYFQYKINLQSLKYFTFGNHNHLTVYDLARLQSNGFDNLTLT